MPGTLAPDAVVPLLRGRFGRPYLYRRTCASTQLLLAGDASEGSLAACELQTAGRGRLGRVWEAPPGTAILCSLVLRPPTTRAVPELSLVGGLIVAETVEGATGLPGLVKWPNDVLLGGNKVAGILAEAGAGAVVIGIGLNVNQRIGELPRDARAPAGSLFTADGIVRDRAPLLAELLERLERAYEMWVSDGLEPLLASLSSRDALRGQQVRAGSASGVAAGIDAAGRLLVETEAGTVAISSGEVTVATL